MIPPPPPPPAPRDLTLADIDAAIASLPRTAVSGSEVPVLTKAEAAALARSIPPPPPPPPLPKRESGFAIEVYIDGELHRIRQGADDSGVAVTAKAGMRAWYLDRMNKGTKQWEAIAKVCLPNGANLYEARERLTGVKSG